MIIPITRRELAELMSRPEVRDAIPKADHPLPFSDGLPANGERIVRLAAYPDRVYVLGK